MDDVFIKCMKCGTCCRNLLENREGILKGLTLTASERKLFAVDVVSPLTAIGMTKPIHIIDYQLNVNDCPHISERNECKIYERRPLVCRAFPYLQNAYSVKCPALARIFKKAGLKIEFPVPYAEAEADEKLKRYSLKRTKKHFTKGQKIWLFDLATRRWIVRLQLA